MKFMQFFGIATFRASRGGIYHSLRAFLREIHQDGQFCFPWQPGAPALEKWCFSTKSAPERRNPTGKDCVWDIFRFPNETHPANRRQPAQPRRKIRSTAMKTASGIPYWPSRDPIGEQGGVNLYGFAYNIPIGWFDDLGNESRQQSVEKANDANRANIDGRNSNKTNAIENRANQGSAALDEAASAAANGASALANLPGLVLDWTGDYQGLSKILSIEKSCAELAKKRAKELGWKACPACCILAFSAPTETGSRATSSRIIRSDLTYHKYNVYQGECEYGAEGTEKQFRKDLGAYQNQRFYEASGEISGLRYELHEITIK